MSRSKIFTKQYRLFPDRTAELLADEPAADIDPDSLLWQHCDLRNAEARQWLIASSDVSPALLRILIADETRPQSIAGESGLLLVLRGINHNPGDTSDDMVSIRLWVEPHRIISTRLRRLVSISDLEQRLKHHRAPSTSGEFVIELVDLLSDRIGDFVNQIEDDLAEIEGQIEEASATQAQRSLGALRRKIASVRRFLTPQRDALSGLTYSDFSIFSASERQRLREETDRVSRYLEDLDLARERAIVLQEVLVGEMAQQQNSRMYVLSVVAAIFLPLSFITSLFGMNVGGLPLANNPEGFWFASGIMLGAAVILLLFFWRKKWF